MVKVIDVAEFQGVIDWSKVKASGIEGAILRCGFGNDSTKQDDKYFKRNADECERLGIPYGVYLYSYATSEDMAKSEAQHILRCIKGRHLSLPVYLDCEEEKTATRNFAKKACEVIGDIITKAGYEFGVYASVSWWNNYLVGMDKYTKWVAQYNNVCQYTKPYDMWQYSSKGRVEGIGTNVDMNECYRELQMQAPSQQPTKSIHEVALEVIDGKWGNGADRKTNLTNAGYDANAVQNEVNAMLKNNSNASYKVKVVPKEGVNIRTGANTTFGIVSAAPCGTELVIKQESHGWGYTVYANKCGWVKLSNTKRI